MQLICLSVSHHNTPVDLRECLSIPAGMMEEAFSKSPIRAGIFEQVTEMAILSTCNRLEVYALVSLGEETEKANAAEASLDAVFQPVLSYLREVFEIPIFQINPYFRCYTGIQAVDHLFQVAAGLDSIALGETQILGQVSRALDTALQLGTARHVLSSLFRAAIHTGKRVRTETEIGRHPTSISTIAVQLAAATLGSLANRKILLIGAGKMGGYTLEALQAHQTEDIFVMNRTFSSAIDMAQRFGGSALPYEQMRDGLLDADVVFTSTAAPQPILQRSLIAQIMKERTKKMLTLIDLAVPRNVDTNVKEIPNVRLYDMDDLQSFAKNAVVRNHQEIAHAERIVGEEVAEYEKLLRIIPFIGELHKKVEDIRQREVEKTLRHLQNISPEISEQIELLSRSLVRKILHEPTMHLRTETNAETLNDYVDTLAKLYDLSEGSALLSLQTGEKWEL